MTNAPIRILIILATISLVGIVATQTYWVNKAISNEKQQFHHNVQMALNNVVESLCQVGGTDIPSGNPIERISNNYFIVRTSNRIDLGAIEYLLKAELEKRAIVQDFEYGVYDCESDQMVYGDLIQLSSSPVVKAKASLPILEDEAYYFGVYFPGRAKGTFGDMDFWMVSTALTIVVVFSLGYGLFVILKHKRLGAIQRDFVNNITHEFKTPLASLKIAAEVFESASSHTPERLAQYGQIVSAETGRLEKQVNQLLKTSMLESNHSLVKTLQPLGEIIQEVIDHFRIREADENLQLTAEIEPNLNVLGDPELLQAVFYNLLDNAIKYGRKPVSIRASLANDRIHVFVKDQGEGIPKHLRKKIFGKFYRVPMGDRHDVKGFGLGLFFVKKVMDKHHATIEVLDPGNIFHLTFKAHV